MCSKKLFVDCSSSINQSKVSEQPVKDECNNGSIVAGLVAGLVVGKIHYVAPIPLMRIFSKWHVMQKQFANIKGVYLSEFFTNEYFSLY